MKKRRLCFLGLTLSFLLFLSACGTVGNKTVSDEKIKSDLLESLTVGIPSTGNEYDFYPQVSSGYEYVFSEFEIEKRQTTLENKTDIVYVNAALSSTDEVIQYTGQFVLFYTLYNDGWILDEISVNSFKYSPLQAAEFTTEEIAEVLNSWNYKNAENIVVNNREVDLNEGRIHYYITATCQYKYVVEDYDVEIVFIFSETGWSIANAGINNVTLTNSNWYIANEFDNPNGRDNLIISVDGLIDTLSVGCNDSISDFYEDISNIHIYKLSEVSLQKIMGDFFKEAHHNFAEYITHYGFSIKMQGAYTNYNSFDYVAWWSCGGNRLEGMLFIGRDNLGYLWSNDYEIDQYNRRVVVDTSELVPLN